MRIVVIGAAGRTGQLVVDKALGHGHEVVAVVHRQRLERDNPRLTKLEGDLGSFVFLSQALAGADAVIVVLSSADSGSAGTLETGIANVVHAMAENRVDRLAVLSAAGTFDRSSKFLSLVQRLRIATGLRRAYDDLEAMERRVMASDLAWTIVRPSGLNNGPATGHYRVMMNGALNPGMRSIGHGDVASLLVKAVETDTYFRRAVVVTGA